MSQKNVGHNNKYEDQDRSSGRMVKWCPGQTELYLTVFFLNSVEILLNCNPTWIWFVYMYTSDAF